MVEEIMVPTGYKKTDIGIIPEEWKVKQLKDEIVSLNAGVSVKSIDDDIPISSYDKCVLKTSAIYNGKFNPKESKKIVKSDIFRAKLNPKADSIIISRMNTPTLVGECGYVEKDYSNLYLPDRLWQTEFKKDNTLCPKWLNYLLNTHEYKYRVKNIATGTSDSMKNISKDKLLEIEIPFPEITEQKVVAGVLSDVDELITSTEKFIDKKEKIKLGTIQRFFINREPLLGFNSEMKIKVMGEIGNAYGGLSGKIKSDFEKGNKPYISFINVMNNTVIDIRELEFVNIEKNEKQNCALQGDLFFNTSSETPEEVGMCSVLLNNIEELYLNSFCFGFRLNKDSGCDPLYLTYYFRSELGRQQLYSLAQGSTRYNLSKNGFYKLEIICPDIEEQKAIVKILSDMDLEIKVLKQKLEKYKMIKQGMMQELLMGRNRLI